MAEIPKSGVIENKTKVNIKKPIAKKKLNTQTTNEGYIDISIPQINKLLGGGLKENNLTCVWAKPGLDSTPFSYQIAVSASKSKKVFYIVNSKSIEAVKNEMKTLGLKSNKINFIDSYSALIGKKSKNNLIIDDPKNINETINSISTISKKIKNSVIILDSYSTLIDLTEKEDISLLNKIKTLNSTIVCVFTEWPYKPAFIKSIRGSFDNIIELSSIEEKLFFRQYFGVTKLKAGEIKKTVIPYRIIKPGGVKIYIPKILVTGPFNSGKTSFIHSASEKAVSVDRLGTTIALDHGHVKYRDFAVDLFGTPGQQRFDPILKLLGGEALGVIVMISAIDPQGYPRAIEMMKKAKVFGLPVVFGANKSNLRGALNTQQILKRLDLKNEVIIPLTAKDLTKVQPGIPCQLNEKDIEKVLDGIFSKLLKRNLK